jgi:hypothetical protein
MPYLGEAQHGSADRDGKLVIEGLASYLMRLTPHFSTPRISSHFLLWTRSSSSYRILKRTRANWFIQFNRDFHSAYLLDKFVLQEITFVYWKYLCSGITLCYLQQGSNVVEWNFNSFNLKKNLLSSSKCFYWDENIFAWTQSRWYCTVVATSGPNLGGVSQAWRWELYIGDISTWFF